MLLRRRPPGIDPRPAQTKPGYRHLPPEWISVLRWLNANHIDFVLVGAAAEAIRGRSDAQGPVSIVPAPYRRNYARLADALGAAQAQQRTEPTGPQPGSGAPVRLTAEKLARGRRWRLCCGVHELDIEAVGTGREGEGESVPGYQELLYEASRFELAEGVCVEVASPEDIAHHAHVARTGSAPQMRITRTRATRGAPV